ncbi:hypothetical protein BC832DRAFT_542433 [Gaertneriomyces semiglobifer]|nr:hypothetical protein BC832DRAFT_542433 [Gaertneriomyces semiglobifer]
MEVDKKSKTQKKQSVTKPEPMEVDTTSKAHKKPEPVKDQVKAKKSVHEEVKELQQQQPSSLITRKSPENKRHTKEAIMDVIRTKVISKGNASGTTLGKHTVSDMYGAPIHFKKTIVDPARLSECASEYYWKGDHDGVSLQDPRQCGRGGPVECQVFVSDTSESSMEDVSENPPKNGFDFRSGMQNTIRLELPATGYVNPANHSLSFQVKHVLKTRTVGTPLPRFQNNIASIFSRIRCSYGSMTFEDLQNQGILARVLTEGATNNTTGVSAQSSISEGVGGTTQCWDKVGKKVSVTNTRFADIQGGTSKSVEDDSLTAAMVVNRQYTIQLPLGLFQQSKLIPLKWMASQLAIELELADYENCVAQTDNKQLEDYFELTNVSLNLELLEFDATYDQAMLEGLRGGGVPIKFATYDCFIATPHKSNKQVLTIPERNRSIKAVFNVQVPGKGTNVNQKYPKDSHAFLQSSTGYFNAMEKPWCVGHVVDFQWRIGGKYHPAQPVVCGTDTATNGAADAYWEFAKALNIVGDYRVTTGLNSTRWARGDARKDAMSNETIDGPSAFVIACNLETSDGTEISGINGEEQNDIALVINYSSEQSPETYYYTFVYYDAMLVLRENNVVELIK